MAKPPFESREGSQGEMAAVNSHDLDIEGVRSISLENYPLGPHQEELTEYITGLIEDVYLQAENQADQGKAEHSLILLFTALAILSGAGIAALKIYFDIIPKRKQAKESNAIIIDSVQRLIAEAEQTLLFHDTRRVEVALDTLVNLHEPHSQGRNDIDYRQERYHKNVQLLLQELRRLQHDPVELSMKGDERETVRRHLYSVSTILNESQNQMDTIVAEEQYVLQTIQAVPERLSTAKLLQSDSPTFFQGDGSQLSPKLTDNLRSKYTALATYLLRAESALKAEQPLESNRILDSFFEKRTQLLEIAQSLSELERMYYEVRDRGEMVDPSLHTIVNPTLLLENSLRIVKVISKKLGQKNPPYVQISEHLHDLETDLSDINRFITEFSEIMEVREYCEKRHTHFVNQGYKPAHGIQAKLKAEALFDEAGIVARTGDWTRATGLLRAGDYYLNHTITLFEQMESLDAENKQNIASLKIESVAAGLKLTNCGKKREKILEDIKGMQVEANQKYSVSYNYIEDRIGEVTQHLSDIDRVLTEVQNQNGPENQNYQSANISILHAFHGYHAVRMELIALEHEIDSLSLDIASENETGDTSATAEVLIKSIERVDVTAGNRVFEIRKTIDGLLPGQLSTTIYEAAEDLQKRLFALRMRLSQSRYLKGENHHTDLRLLNAEYLAFAEQECERVEHLIDVQKYNHGLTVERGIAQVRKAKDKLKSAAILVSDPSTAEAGKGLYEQALEIPLEMPKIDDYPVDVTRKLSDAALAQVLAQNAQTTAKYHRDKAKDSSDTKQLLRNRRSQSGEQLAAQKQARIEQNKLLARGARMSYGTIQ